MVFCRGSWGQLEGDGAGEWKEILGRGSKKNYLEGGHTHIRRIRQTVALGGSPRLTATPKEKSL